MFSDTFGLRSTLGFFTTDIHRYPQMFSDTFGLRSQGFLTADERYLSVFICGLSLSC